MRKIGLILGLMAALCAGSYAQPGSSTQQQQQPPQGANAQERDRDAQQSTADTPGAADAATDANNDNKGQNDGDDGRASNAPAVPQTTTSQSGSPAVLSGNNGEDRDGTNSVQRASMNMAGSPANNLQLDDKKSEDVNSESKDRQNYEQDKAMSATSKSSKSGNNSQSGGESSQINEKTRRENNAASDQNLSAKEGRSSQSSSDKPNRKSKRNKSKG